MENIVFVYPFFLFLLLWVGGIWMYIIFKKKQGIQLVSYEDIRKVYKTHVWNIYVYFTLLFFIACIFIVILAKPVERNAIEEIEKNGIDIALVFDVSYSMEATDISPSRILVAKKVITQFIDNIKTDRIWFVFFAGKPFISTPLTFDTIFLKKYLDRVTTSTIDQTQSQLQWTAIGDAMLLWERLLEDEKASDRKKVMILVTDGEANVWIDPKIALKMLKEKNIKMYTIWVWWLEKTFVLTPDVFWRTQKLEIGWVDEGTLKKMAQETWWKYYRATSKEAMEQVFEDIGKLEKKNIVVQTRLSQTERFSELAKILIVLQVLLFGIIFFKKIRL